MKNIILLISIVLSLSSISNATFVLTFDDIGTTPVDANPIPFGYGGFDWHDISYLDPSIVTTDSGYANGIVSGSYVALVSNYPHEGIGWLTGNPFTFNSAYLTAAWRDGLNVQVDGYLNDVLTYSTTVIISTTSPTLCEFDYTNIDELRFSASGGVVHEGYIGDNTQFVMDHFSYIPEPVTSLLLIVGTLLSRRRR